jgi:hypothetical protein
MSAVWLCRLAFKPRIGRGTLYVSISLSRPVPGRIHKRSTNMSYEGRLARRVLWRRRKLWVHSRESKAAISIQCAIRIYLARKRVQRQVCPPVALKVAARLSG